jgi:CRISPR-associated endoribonuclease Cas6
LRLKIKLYSQNNRTIPYNYQYQFSSALYLLLKFGSREFSDFLHNCGYKLNGKPYKLFTFAVQFEQFKPQRDHIKLESPYIYLYVSSPIVDEFIKNFVIGSFERTFFYISSGGNEIKFIIKNMELLPQPEFQSETKFKLLSPLVLSTLKEYNGKLSTYYLRPEDKEDINRILTNNLLNKYALIYDRKIDCKVELDWDEDYMNKHPRVTKKITINEYGRNPVDIIGLIAPFNLKGEKELMRIGYECGFGEKNSMGFGMAEIIK